MGGGQWAVLGQGAGGGGEKIAGWAESAGCISTEQEGRDSIHVQ